MNSEIEALRKILGQQEETMANAGLQMQSYTELLDPGILAERSGGKQERGFDVRRGLVRAAAKRAGVSWKRCLRRGELKTVNEILFEVRGPAIALEAPEARRDDSDWLVRPCGVLRKRRRQRV